MDDTIHSRFADGESTCGASGELTDQFDQISCGRCREMEGGY